MADGVRAWLEDVLGPHGLVVYDSSDPAAKPLARDVFVRELSQPGETARLAAKAGEALVAAGYHAQVTPPKAPSRCSTSTTSARADPHRGQDGRRRRARR